MQQNASGALKMQLKKSCGTAAALFRLLIKWFLCIDRRCPAFAFRDAFRAGRAQLNSSARRLEELDLRLVLDRPGVAPAAAAGK
ncbi:MAG: hypothetical protein EA344_02545 [Alkalicoccus sp.]|nr:MAG: hypothetical protein EA344_02545 [Alkalicoccus sp.]